MDYKVIKTPMYPNEWKVESVKWPGTDNSFINYFSKREDAEKECARRNGA